MKMSVFKVFSAFPVLLFFRHIGHLSQNAYTILELNFFTNSNYKLHPLSLNFLQGKETFLDNKVNLEVRVCNSLSNSCSI